MRGAEGAGRKQEQQRDENRGRSARQDGTGAPCPKQPVGVPRGEHGPLPERVQHPGDQSIRYAAGGTGGRVGHVIGGRLLWADRALRLLRRLGALGACVAPGAGRARRVRAGLVGDHPGRARLRRHGRE